MKKIFLCFAVMFLLCGIPSYAIEILEDEDVSQSEDISQYDWNVGFDGNYLMNLPDSAFSTVYMEFAGKKTATKTVTYSQDFPLGDGFEEGYDYDFLLEEIEPFIFFPSIPVFYNLNHSFLDVYVVYNGVKHTIDGSPFSYVDGVNEITVCVDIEFTSKFQGMVGTTPEDKEFLYYADFTSVKFKRLRTVSQSLPVITYNSSILTPDTETEGSRIVAYASRDNTEEFNKISKWDLNDQRLQRYDFENAFFTPNIYADIGGKYRHIVSGGEFLQLGRTYRVTVDKMHFSGNVAMCGGLDYFNSIPPSYGRVITSLKYGGKTYLSGTGSFEIEVTDVSDYFEFVSTGKALYLGKSTDTGYYMVYQGVDFFMTVEDITKDINVSVENIEKHIEEINEREKEQDKLLNDTSDDWDDGLGDTLKDLDDVEGKILDDTMGTINDVNFDDSSIDLMPTGFLGAFSWVGAKLQQLFGLTEFSVVLPVVSILALACILVGLRRLWS